jgi:hypothetical protein
MMSLSKLESPVGWSHKGYYCIDGRVYTIDGRVYTKDLCPVADKKETLYVKSLCQVVK